MKVATAPAAAPPASANPWFPSRDTTANSVVTANGVAAVATARPIHVRMSELWLKAAGAWAGLAYLTLMC